MRCPKCGVLGQAGDRYCENDGTPLVDEQGRSVVVKGVLGLGRCGCGTNMDGGDGHCERCGHTIATPRRRMLRLSPRLAIATDRGRRHPLNQDAAVIGLAAHGEVEMPVIVLCDGVSSARHSQRAAGVAAQAAWARLAGWLTSRSRSAVEAMREAIGAASRAIISLDDLPHLAVEGDAPSSTIVAAVVADQQLTIGWVGDSRAYWCGRDDAQLLTRDHSWAVEAVAAGQLGQRPLPTDPMAHALTRWLGSGATDEPTVINLSVPSDGTLVVCSDGLWNYLPEAEQIAALVRSGLVAGRDAGGIAQRLVAQALTAGGKDNITVGVAVL